VRHHFFFINFSTGNFSIRLRCERRGWDSNPRDTFGVHALSRRADSTALAPLLKQKPVAARQLAEREGFEPPVSCPTVDFESTAFDHSAISPPL
jgi:hypothetical protein